MPQLSGDVIKKRAGQLRDEATQRLHGFLDNAIGSRDQILVESGNRGHGRGYAKMRLDGAFVTPGSILDVTVTAREDDTLVVTRIGQ